jgi:hypothetical protein
MNSSFQHCAYNRIPTTELNAGTKLETLTIVCCFPRERRGPDKPDVREPRRNDSLDDEASVPIVSFGIFTRLGIP